MKITIYLLALTLFASVGVSAAEKQPIKTDKPATALQKLKEQCDNPKASQQLAWPGYLSETELVRFQAIEELKAEKDGLNTVRREMGTAKGEYRQMLVVALAVLGDKDALSPAAQVMLNADKPAARVVAALELRRLKDKSLVEPFKQAMTDKFKRERGGCVGPETMAYPVRMIATDALVELGLSLDEVHKIGYWWDLP